MTHKFLSRRKVLQAGIVSGVGLGASAACASEGSKTVTPRQTSGPFYPIVEQADKDADLTVFGDSPDIALGEIVTVEGRVYGSDGDPIAEAIVDIWQANAAGRYAHESDPNAAPLDPSFQGWAILTTDTNGRYRFKTVKPGAYPAARGWDRPPHIHFKVSRRGFHEITTQMYFENEPLNDIDLILNALSEPDQESVIAKHSRTTGAYKFDIILAKVEI